MRLEDVPVPQPTPGEILLKVHSVSVNRTLDLIVRAGRYPVKIQLPHVLGADPSGEIVETGGAVYSYKSVVLNTNRMKPQEVAHG